MTTGPRLIYNERDYLITSINNSLKCIYDNTRKSSNLAWLAVESDSSGSQRSIPQCIVYTNNYSAQYKNMTQYTMTQVVQKYFLVN